MRGQKILTGQHLTINITIFPLWQNTQQKFRRSRKACFDFFKHPFNPYNRCTSPSLTILIHQGERALNKLCKTRRDKLHGQSTSLKDKLHMVKLYHKRSKPHKNLQCLCFARSLSDLLRSGSCHNERRN